MMNVSRLMRLRSHQSVSADREKDVAIVRYVGLLAHFASRRAGIGGRRSSDAGQVPAHKISLFALSGY